MNIQYRDRDMILLNVWLNEIFRGVEGVGPLAGSIVGCNGRFSQFFVRGYTFAFEAMLKLVLSKISKIISRSRY